MSDLSVYVRLFLKKALRVALRMSFFIPIKSNRILFFAGMRGYTCSPKYICEYLHDNYPGKFELCWIGKDVTDIENHPYLTFVKFSPFSLFYALASSKVFITNGENSICPLSHKRLVVCTWHGVPFKKVGYASTDKFALIDMDHSAIDLFLSASKNYTKEVIDKSFHYKGRVLNCGYPRNDIFFSIKKMDEAKNRIKTFYEIKGKTVLFAPTYRGNYQSGDVINIKLDFTRLEKSLKNKYGNDISILVRMHYFDKNEYDLPKTIIDVGEWPDMQEIMCATDVLITDYSSTIWDFALTGRPCLLFVPDLNQYASTRGLYSDPSTWPGIVCRDMDSLCLAIENLDEEKCNVTATKYLMSLGSYENGNATKMACEEIVKFIG